MKHLKDLEVEFVQQSHRCRPKQNQMTSSRTTGNCFLVTHHSAKADVAVMYTKKHAACSAAPKWP